MLISLYAHFSHVRGTDCRISPSSLPAWAEALQNRFELINSCHASLLAPLECGRLQVICTLLPCVPAQYRNRFDVHLVTCLEINE